MRYTLWKLKRKVMYARYVIQVSVVFIVEDIKDYIFSGRERSKDDRGE